jgi:hypothetical protein
VSSVKSLKRQLPSPLQRKMVKELNRLYHRELSGVESDLIIWSTFRKLVVGLVGQDDPDFANQVTSLVKDKEVSRILDLTASRADPQLYESASSYWKYAVIGSFLKKFPFGNVPNLNPLLAAKERSAQAELLCRITNKRLSHNRTRGYRLNNNRQYVNEVFHLARLKISRWLGEVSPGEIASKSRHGPGGCIGVKRPMTTKYYKYSADQYTVSARCVPYVRALFMSDPLWVRALSGLGPFDYGPPFPLDFVLRERVTVTDYNKVTYVPKTAQVHRAIAVEPMLNIYFQLGVGKVLRDRLRKIGLDLSSSWERNKKYAYIGSCGADGSPSNLATVDLSMASDTLAIELVRELLPPDWFDVLSTLRSPNGLFEDGLKPWAKFSSMGNGYTFELETMIFYALALSLCQVLGQSSKFITVFGDDIVIPSAILNQFTDLLRYSGFRINTKKTFAIGPFRESCGGDYFRGADVRPFYLKNQLLSVKDLIFLRNSLWLMAGKAVSLGLDPLSFHEGINFIDSRMPRLLRDHLLGPSSGPIDGTLFTDFDLAHKSYLVVWDRDLQQMKYPAFRPTAREYHGEQSFVYLQFIEGTRQGDERFVFNWGRATDPEIRSQGIVTRSQSVVTRLHLEVSHNWD